MEVPGHPHLGQEPINQPNHKCYFMKQKKEATTHSVKGHPLTCPICGNTTFWTRKTLMNTAGMTLAGIEWANKSAINYVCDQCGHILWFLEG